MIASALETAVALSILSTGAGLLAGAACEAQAPISISPEKLTTKSNVRSQDTKWSIRESRKVGLTRFNGRVSGRSYAASSNCFSYAAGLRYPSVEWRRFGLYHVSM